MNTIDRARVGRLSAILKGLRKEIDKLVEERAVYSCHENQTRYDQRIQKLRVQLDKVFGIRAHIYRKYSLTSIGTEPSDPNKWDWQES